ncbi:hypothetical protein PAMP_005167 [Pampus punctatissimus]
MAEHCVYGEPLKHTPQSHTNTLQTVMLSIRQYIESEEFTFSTNPMTALLIPGNITAAAKTIPKDHKRDVWCFCEMIQPLFGVLL